MATWRTLRWSHITVFTRRFGALSACLALACQAGSVAPAVPVLTSEASGTTQRLQAVSVVSDRVAWVSGTGGTYLRTTDGGVTWQAGLVPGADSLEFRDVDAVSADDAFLLSAGPGDRSRIYHTSDGGRNWTLQFTNAEPRAFFDCLALWDKDDGLAFSDAVDGVFPILITADGGQHWSPLPAAQLPPALAGEGGFAASGTCAITRGTSTAFIATGAGGKARVLRTDDRGTTWRVAETPVTHGPPTAGLTSVAFRDGSHGVVVGGDIGQAADTSGNVALTDDGGLTWRLGARTSFPGAAYGTAYLGGGPALIAVGPKGAAYSPDEGKSWTTLDTLSYWSVGLDAGRTGWLVGPGGRVTRVQY